MTAVPVAVCLVGALRRSMVMRHPVVPRVRFGHRVADVAGYRLAGAVVAALLDPALKVCDRGVRRVEGDRGGLGDGIGLDREHARPTAQDLLDDRLLTGVKRAADVQDDRLGR